MNGFKNYLRSLGTLSEQSIKDDISRLNIMKNRSIDYTIGEDYVKIRLETTDLSESTKKSCLRLCRRYSDYKEVFNKDIVISIIEAYEKAILDSQSEQKTKDNKIVNIGGLHKLRSSKFIEYVSEVIDGKLEDDQICVFSRTSNAHKDFKLSEYLFDIHVCRMKKLQSVNGNDVEYIEKTLVQIEAEFSNNSKEVSKDFSKLVCGNADLKVMIIQRVYNEEGFRNSFLDIANNISGELYLIQLDHPGNWNSCNPSDYKIFIYNGNWERIEY